MALVTLKLDELRNHVGQRLGAGPWHEVTQEQVGLFADATGDHQWIHLDAERAKTGPFGGTIAHGFLTLSLASRVRADVSCVAVDDVPGGRQATYAVTLEREGGTKPVCVAELLLRYGA